MKKSIEENLSKVPVGAREELDAFYSKYGSLRESIVVDMYGLSGSNGLSREQIIEKYKPFDVDMATHLCIYDLKNIENEAYAHFKCIIGTPLYNEKKEDDINFAKQLIMQVPELQEGFNLIEGFTDSDIMTKLIMEKKITNGDYLIRLSIFSARLKCDLEAQLEKTDNQRAK